ncbi:MAG: FemAB family XrtA/PEP-CTERM system-associated protein [Nitrospiraceae bacterium]
MPIRLYKDEDCAKWEDYVKRSSASNYYHQLGWKNVIEKSFGHKTHYLLCEEGDQIKGIFPLVHLKSLLFGNFLVSMPYFNYGGICADSIDVHHQLLHEAVRIAQRENAHHIEVRDSRVLDYGWRMKTAKVAMRLELRASADELWHALPSKLRSQVRRSSREGISCRIGRMEELDSFYKVFCIRMRELGTPVYPKYFFENILNEFRETTWICSVYMGTRPVAAGFVAGSRDTMEIPWAASMSAYNHLSPNMLLYWSALKFACENGYSIFDFGRSSPGEGTYKFKEQWGAKAHPLFWYYWMEDEGELPQLNPKNPKYRMAIEVWKRLPVSLTRLIGPAIVKNLP